MKKISLLALSILCSNVAFGKVFQMTMNPKSVISIVKKFLPANQPISILEAGSFDGDDTESLSKVWSKSTIYAFEPVPEIFGWLEKRTKNIPQVLRYQVALSDKTGTATFNISETRDGLWQSGSLLAPKDHLDLAPQVKFKKEIEVPTITLDEWAAQNDVESIDLLWLDMQGVELDVLKPSKIALTAKVIYTEIEFVEAYKGQYTFNDIQKWMYENGYVMMAKDWTTPRPKRIWFGNAIYVKKDYLKSIGFQ
ncbi:MAG TPA: FkbM family methyltransferase [Candidatus Babeliales bacterium]|nr:FkbM family methyltransferase [Candidatus Babeliales bacterium]